MNNIIELMNNYFVFLHEFMEVYTKYSYCDEKNSSRLRKMSSLNNEKIDEIHKNIDDLSSDEKLSLKEKVNELIISLQEERNILYINLKLINPEDASSFASGMQHISDKIGDIEHKIYCYGRIILSYLNEKKIIKK